MIYVKFRHQQLEDSMWPGVRLAVCLEVGTRALFLVLLCSAHCLHSARERLLHIITHFLNIPWFTLYLRLHIVLLISKNIVCLLAWVLRENMRGQKTPMSSFGTTTCCWQSRWEFHGSCPALLGSFSSPPLLGTEMLQVSGSRFPLPWVVPAQSVSDHSQPMLLPLEIGTPAARPHLLSFQALWRVIHPFSAWLLMSISKSNSQLRILLLVSRTQNDNTHDELPFIIPILQMLTLRLTEIRLSSFYHEQSLWLWIFPIFLPMGLKQFIYEFALFPKTQAIGGSEYKIRICDGCLYSKNLDKAKH